jgi:hypothetical protein
VTLKTLLTERTESMKTITNRILHLALLIGLSALLVGVAGCGNNNNGTAEWILKAQKPIICKYSGEYWNGHREWTLIAADGQVYATGGVTMQLPDTISATSN